MSTALSIGLSGLRASQRIIDLLGQNIANANTPGFHRQSAILAMRTVGGETGLGVEVTHIRRTINSLLETAIHRNNGSLSDVTTQLDTLRQVEARIGIGEGSIHDLLGKFFNQVEQLSGRPDDLTQRRVLVTTASTLTKQINSAANELAQIRGNLNNQLTATVDKINGLTERIAALNLQVQRNTLQGVNPNDLADQRDQLIGELSQLVDVRTVDQKYGVVNVLAAGVPVVLNESAIKLQVSIDTNDQAVVSTQGLQTPLTVSGGQLAGELTLRNQTLPDVQTRLQTLAREFVRQVDAIQATGLGLNGPLSILNGQRAVNNINVPLAQANLAFPPQVGSLYVSVTNLATGQRVLSQVNIDPTTQSLNDVATALSGVANLQAVVDPQTRTLTVMAAPGFAFDFAGRLPTAPENLAFTGTSTPQIAGVYSGSTNDNYSFQVVGTGTIGVTPNLTLEVRNGAGALIASHNIGQGYEPGKDLPAVDGVRVRLSAGTVNNGDSFTLRVVAQPDTAGLLPALGLNSFFQGDTVGSLAVRPDLITNPERLSASRTGQAGDATNLHRLAAVRDAKLLSNGTATVGEFYATLAAEIGSRVEDLDLRQSSYDALGQRLEAERQSISGVDPNEEMLRLLQFQRAFQFSARYLAAVNETLDDLLRLV